MGIKIHFFPEELEPGAAPDLAPARKSPWNAGKIPKSGRVIWDLGFGLVFCHIPGAGAGSGWESGAVPTELLLELAFCPF